MWLSILEVHSASTGSPICSATWGGQRMAPADSVLREKSHANLENGEWIRPNLTLLKKKTDFRRCVLSDHTHRLNSVTAKLVLGVEAKSYPDHNG